VQVGDRLILTSLQDAQVEPAGLHGDLGARLTWAGEPQGPSFAAPACGLRAVAAIVRAAAIAGAGDRLLNMTIAYANERVQFGKPIGKQQALQQQLAVMAEQVVAARIAAQIGCAGGFPPAVAAAAVAKQVSSAGATLIADTAHAVHGAIGISEEFDLQLYSRRLREWRLADGSEGYWAGVLGAERLAAGGEVTVDFIRDRLASAVG
jgi:acyl-CoA dehydrogenase